MPDVYDVSNGVCDMPHCLKHTVITIASAMIRAGLVR